jgi:outer membrane protein OmpA-like peptidoglycan-associated protein
VPSGRPSNDPTSSQPSGRPSNDPTSSSPSGRPSNDPTSSFPTGRPSSEPSSSEPSGRPTCEPTSSMPSGRPSNDPTSSSPSGRPSNDPTSSQPSGRPSNDPTSSFPTGRPSSEPSSSEPSGRPSCEPTSSMPSGRPSNDPTSSQPSGRPSNDPTSSQPSGRPSNDPTSSQPSGRPSSNPTSSQPSGRPSNDPTSSFPTGRPSSEPSSSEPSGRPSCEPTSSVPSGRPSNDPTSSQPSGRPSNDPTSSQLSGRPSNDPTSSQPSGRPSNDPTSSQPSGRPSNDPTSSFPTGRPSSEPSSSAPSGRPSCEPTSSVPSGRPSNDPTSSQPSGRPSNDPTSSQPSGRPSNDPTSSQPSGRPSNDPTSSQPSGRPSNDPTSSFPTGRPSSEPSSSEPSGRPSCEPTSSMPSGRPSNDPTSSQPSGRPSNDPTSSQPSGRPSNDPTSSSPSGRPSNDPTSSQPSGRPSSDPTSSQPSGRPTSDPTSSQPSGRPSNDPTSSQPSSRPSNDPTSSQPSGRPSSEPSSSKPSGRPSCEPTSSAPSGRPSNDPTSSQPSGRPSSDPTSSQPSGRPSSDPTSSQPSSDPTSSQPSCDPTSSQPSSRPSGRPSSNPTSSQPSGRPSSDPTSSSPTVAPSVKPTVDGETNPPSGVPSSSSPSGVPTSSSPSGRPSNDPTSSVPSGRPSSEPSSSEPSGRPSCEPTSSVPSSRPSGRPSSDPTSSSPTVAPSVRPTFDGETNPPSGVPSSSSPSGVPTSSSPTVAPSVKPTVDGETNPPSGVPSSSSPSGRPSSDPTSSRPSGRPSSNPTSSQPSGRPSSDPTSSSPTVAPSVKPTVDGETNPPSAAPSSAPSAFPTTEPTSQPTCNPTGEPSAQPSASPSSAPSGVPTTEPTSQPSGVPTRKPSAQPSAAPSSAPSAVPSVVPTTASPTVSPSAKPSAIPTSAPSSTPSVSGDTNNPTSAPTVPPPELVSAIFSSAGRYITVKMSANTDRAAFVLSSVTNSFSCNLVLTFPGAAEDQCLWTDKSTILVTVSSTSVYALVGDQLYLQASRTKASCSSVAECNAFLFSPPSFVLIGYPSSPITPSVSVTSPSPINRCGNIVLTTTGSLNRGSAPWQALDWTVTSMDGNNTEAVEEYLNTATGSVTGVFTVDNSLLTEGTYSFKLCATNMFSLSACFTRSVTVLADMTIPTVTLSGVTSTFRYKSLFINGYGSVPGCGSTSPSTTGLTYVFALYKDDVNGELQTIPSVSNNPSVFKLNALALEVSQSYALKLTVTKTKSGVSNTAVHSFVVGRAGTKAFISQGSQTEVYALGQRSLDADSSYDLDYPSIKTDLAYAWSCETITPVAGEACPGSPSYSSTSAIVLDGIAFNNESYKFTVMVRNVMVTDSGSEVSIVVNVKLGLPFPTMNFVGLQEKYNRDLRLILTVDINTLFPSSQITWNLFDSNGDAENLAQIALTPLTKSLSSGLSTVGLTVAKNTLTEGASYTFRISATYYPQQSANTAQTVSEVIVQINSAPYGGSFSVSPTTGDALITEFRFAAYGWTDDDSDLPLEYQFAYYVDTAESSFLLIDYDEASALTALMGPGLAANEFEVTCIVRIADALGYAILREVDEIVVSPPSLTGIVNVSDYLRQTVDPTLRRQLAVALRTSINTVDCSTAPDCGALNRQECRATAGTCGNCLSSFPVGVYGDSNVACTVYSTRRLSASALPLSTVDSVKKCAGNCSSQGKCVATNWLGENVTSCDVLDPSCRVACQCDAGWYSIDCSQDLLTFESFVSVRNALCNSSYGSLSTADLSDDIVKGYAVEVSGTMIDLTQVSEEAYRDCSLVILDIIDKVPGVAASDIALPYIIESLSAILEKGEDVPDDIYERVISSVKVLSEERQKLVSAEEAPFELYTRNLRFFVSVNFLGSFTNATTWDVAISALERDVGTNSSSFVLDSTAAHNDSVGVTTKILGVAIWQVLINTGRTSGLNGSLVELQTTAIGSDTETTFIDTIFVVSYNHEPINYDVDQEIIHGTVFCHAVSSNRPFQTTVPCGDDMVDVTCPGNFSLYMDYTCPYHVDAPQCLFYDGTDYVANPACELVSYDSFSTTCSCEANPVSRRRALPTASSSKSYEFISTKKVNTVDLTVVWNALTPNNLGDNVIIFIMTLIFTFLTMVGFIFLLRNDKSRPVDPMINHYRRVMNVAAHILSYEHGHNNVYRRYFYALWRKSEYLSIFRWKSVLSQSDTADLFEKWFVLAGYFLNFMFVHAIFAWSVYDDDGSCENILREDKCEDRDSLLLLNSRCEWRSDGDPYCRLRSPLQSYYEIFILVGFCALFVIPLNYFWRIAVHNLTNRFMGQGSHTIAIEVSNSQKNSIKDSNSGKASGKMRDASITEKYYKTMNKSTLLNLGVSEGLVEEECDYVFSAAKKLVTDSEAEAEAMTANSMHRIYLKNKLRLNMSGDIRDKDNIVPRAAARVSKKLKRSRRTATEMVDTMALFQEPELQNSYIIVQFLLHCLPESLRNFAVKYFLSSNDFYSTYTIGSSFYKYSIYLLPVYTIGVLIVLVVLGFQWYSQQTTKAWACLVAISFLFDCVVHIPFRVYFRNIVIPAFFMTELRRIHRRIRSRYAAIVAQMRKGATTPGVELVQHFNPGCRAARLAPMSTNIMDSFMFITDNDLPVLQEEVDGEGFWALITKVLTIVAYAVTVSVYWLTPEVLVDIVLDWMIIGFCLWLLVAFYALSTVAVFLPFVVILFIAVILVIREIVLHGRRNYHGRHGSHVHAEGEAAHKPAALTYDRRFSTQSFDHSLQSIFIRALLDNEHEVKMASQAELTTVRKALLDSMEEDKDELDQKFPSPVVQKPDEEPREKVILPIVESSVKVSPDSSPAPTPVLAPIKVAPMSPEPSAEPVTPTMSQKKRGKEYVHLTSLDYRILSEAIIKYLESKHKEKEDKGQTFMGVITPEAVEYVLNENENLGTSFATDDKKRAGKVISKVIKHMIDKDGTVVVIPQDGKADVKVAPANALEKEDYQSMMIRTAESFAPGDKSAGYDGVPFEECCIALYHPQVPGSPDKPTSPLSRQNTTKARVQVNTSDYKIITQSVLVYLKKEEEKWDEQSGDVGNFPGMQASDVVDRVIDQNNAEMKSPEFINELKKHKKVIHKIVSRMVHKDGSLDMVGEVESIPARGGGKPKNPPHDDTFVRLHRGPAREPEAAAEPEGVPAPAKKTLKAVSVTVKASNLLKSQLKEQVKEFMESKEITFEKNSPEMDAEGKETCRTIAGWFSAHPHMEINIDSHTNCFAGKCDQKCYLQELSQERCDKVKECFVASGCQNVILSKGWGCKHPELGKVK